MLLESNQLCDFYDNDKRVPLSKAPQKDKYAFLDDPENASVFYGFYQKHRAFIQVKSPHIQCASCVYLLEKLPQLQEGIFQSSVDFSQQQISIHFNPEIISLRNLIEWLSFIGYEPILDHEKNTQDLTLKIKRDYWLAIGISGFCFANIMLLSFPEYLHLEMDDMPQMTQLFRWINFGLSIPALLFGAKSFFVKTIQGLRANTLPIDAPLVASLLLTFGRSSYEVFSGTGGGYFDSLTGIIFFMLIGRYFQETTQIQLHFSRTFKSFFPLSCKTISTEGKTIWKKLSEIQKGDKIKVHAHEMIPCDGELLSEQALIDYSFVTGESRPIAVSKGDKLYAGGKQLGQAIELQSTSNVEHSYLTSLWNQKQSTQKMGTQMTWVDLWARNFTIFLFILSLAAGWYWWDIDRSRAFQSMTTVLIVACPCALLLANAFTQGAVLKQLQHIGCHIKNALILDKLAEIQNIVWDKTGTLTSKDAIASFVLRPSTSDQLAIHAIVNQSAHPLSQSIASITSESEIVVENFHEHMGKGVEGKVNGVHYQIGSQKWMSISDDTDQGISVWIKANNTIIGSVKMVHELRPCIPQTLKSLGKKFSMAILSGDPLPFESNIIEALPEGCHGYHGLSPEQKKNHIIDFEDNHEKTLMIGDGLNDAGALETAHVGMAITENAHTFSPACDIILEADNMDMIPEILRYAKTHQRIIQWSFGISLLYNIIGLSFAVQGQLNPFIAAVLMPISSITIMAFTTGMAHALRPQRCR
jgi:Cu+-exporting ATPase